jgi:hypothetical protein
MRVPVRSLYATVIATAALLGACDNAVAPPAIRPPADPNPLIILGGVTWTRTTLPFMPRAINAAGVIVGINGSEAVRWTNGVLDTLPHLAGLSGPYTAVDITPNGIVLGGANGHILYWAQHNAPVDPSAGSSFAGSLTPIAMNDSYTIVGWSRNDLTAITTVRWNGSGAWVDIGAGYGHSGADQTVVTGLNALGQASGWRMIYSSQLSTPIKWNAASTSPISLSSSSGEGRGIDDNGNIFGFTDSGTMMWYANGTSGLVSGLPGFAWKRSNTGRFVGTAMNGGATQIYTSFNGALTWLPGPDGSSPNPAGVNNCGTIIANNGSTGLMWKRTSIVAAKTCDVQLVLNAGP